jgi:DNA-binding GntR family transcriptional regulator
LIRKSKRGLQVVKLTPEETAYQMEFRAIVECAAVRLVAERITPVEIERLREVVVEQEVLLNSQDFQALYESDLHFHQLLLKASRNPFIYRLSAALGMSFSAANATVSSVAIRTHASLLDAVGTGDADGAEKLMYEHIIGKAAS